MKVFMYPRTPRAWKKLIEDTDINVLKLMYKQVNAEYKRLHAKTIDLSSDAMDLNDVISDLQNAGVDEDTGLPYHWYVDRHNKTIRHYECLVDVEHGDPEGRTARITRSLDNRPGIYDLSLRKAGPRSSNTVWKTVRYLEKRDAHMFAIAWVTYNELTEAQMTDGRPKPRKM